MSAQTRVIHTRGGRELRTSYLGLEDMQSLQFGLNLREQGLTAGLETGAEVYVTDMDSGREISAHGREHDTVESVLRTASADGEIIGKTFVIDVTTEHRGAVMREA